MLHPEAQSKAQEEIDRVIGVERLPDFNDRDALPFVECAIKETQRYVLQADAGLSSGELTGCGLDDIQMAPGHAKCSTSLDRRRRVSWCACTCRITSHRKC